MLDWLISERDAIAAAFDRVFRRSGTPFGSAALHWGGLHDGAEGVQWNVGYDPRGPRRWVGVNLEGLKYDGWPLARLIMKETRRPTLPELVSSDPRLADVQLRMEREFWSGRNRVHRESIAELPLLEVTPTAWRRILFDARNCLAASNGGRARVDYVPKGGGATAPAELTPHLAFRIVTQTAVDWPMFLRQGVDHLESLHDWTTERTRH